MAKINAGRGGKGSISLAGDKSISHRLILFSLLHQGHFKITNLAQGLDVKSSLTAFTALGGHYRQLSATSMELTGLNSNFSLNEQQIDCGNSGTTARLLAGILAGAPGKYKLVGDQSLSGRPMQRIIAPLKSMGANIESAAGTLPLIIKGNPELLAADYHMPVASAQVKSAIMLAGCQAAGKTRVRNCQGCRDHSERLLKFLGAEIDFNEQFVEICGPFKSRGDYEFYVPGDLSSAAFFIVAATLLPDSNILLRNILLNPGRTSFIDVLQEMGADIEITYARQGFEPGGDIRVKYSPLLHGITPDPKIIPRIIDELPALAIAMTFANGISRIRNAAELRVKESDRIATLCQALFEAGAEVFEHSDGFTIRGNRKFQPAGSLKTGNDHRIAAALSILGLKSKEGIELDNTDCSKISFPEFETKFLHCFSASL